MALLSVFRKGDTALNFFFPQVTEKKGEIFFHRLFMASDRCFFGSFKQIQPTKSSLQVSIGYLETLSHFKILF
jgi:hypothetical protein